MIWQRAVNIALIGSYVASTMLIWIAVRSLVFERTDAATAVIGILLGLAGWILLVEIGSHVLAWRDKISGRST